MDLQKCESVKKSRQDILRERKIRIVLSGVSTERQKVPYKVMSWRLC